LATRKPEERPLQRFLPCAVPNRPRSIRAASVELADLRGLRGTRRRNSKSRVYLAMRSAAGHGLPRALLDLRPSPAGALEDLREHRLPGSEPPDASTSVTFTSPSMRPHTAGNPSRIAVTEVSTRHGFHPLLEFARLPPLHRHTVRASTPGDQSLLRADGTTRFGSCSALVVSHHLDGFLRAAAAGLLHPATGLGFATFRDAVSRGLSREASVTDLVSRDAGSHPSKSSPHRQPHHVTAIARVHRGRCPLAVTARSPRRPRSSLRGRAPPRRSRALGAIAPAETDSILPSLRAAWGRDPLVAS